MVKDYLLLSLFGTMIVSGQFTCPRSGMTLVGSKCYKLIQGSPDSGQENCTKDDPNSALMLPPTRVAAKDISMMFPDATIWVGLRFHNGAEWLWNDGSHESTLSNNTDQVPQLCIVLLADSTMTHDGSLHDRYCYEKDGLICQKEIEPLRYDCDSGWKKLRNLCYKRLRRKSDGVTFRDARLLCSNESAYIMMPRSQSEAREITNDLKCGKLCWIGITDFDADHTYTWENGTHINQSSLFFSVTKNQPNRRKFDYICAYIKHGNLDIGECNATKSVICEIDAIDSSQTMASVQMSTQTNGLSAYIQTKMFTPAIRTNVTIMTTSLDYTKTSVMSSTESGENTEHTGTSDHNSDSQFGNTTIITDEYLVSTVSDSSLPCILKCTSSCANRTADANINVPYKVNKKLLSSYRRTHCSANDTRMSSFYIGCIGTAVLFLTILFIVVLDCLPRA